MPDDEVWITPISNYGSDDKHRFEVWVSANLIRRLLMHEVTPEDWDEYVSGFIFRIKKLYAEPIDVTPDGLRECFEEQRDETPHKKTGTIFTRILNTLRGYSR
jgi:hypothetical protein